MRVLDFPNDDDTVQTTDTVDVAEGVKHEVLVVFHVVGIDFDLEVVVARGIIALGYLVDGLHGVHELLDEIVGVLLQTDVAQHDDIMPHLVMIYYSSVSLDISLSLQSLLSFESR